jgi:hypothetical protein
VEKSYVGEWVYFPQWPWRVERGVCVENDVHLRLPTKGMMALGGTPGLILAGTLRREIWR